MTVYMCDIHGIKKHAQVKAMLAFTIEFVSSCFLIHYIYTIHAIVVKRNDIKTGSRNFLWILSSIHTAWNDSFKWLMIQILWSFSVLLCSVLSAKWLFGKTTCFLGLAKVFWMPTLPTKWLQSQNIGMLGNLFTVMM